REIVAVHRGDRAMAQEVAVRVVEDRARRYFLQSLEQLALVGGAMIERLPQLDAADEDKGLRCAGRHGVSEESKATGKWAKTAPRPSASPCSRSEEHTSELQSLAYLVCRLLLEKKKTS